MMRLAYNREADVLTVLNLSTHDAREILPAIQEAKQAWIEVSLEHGDLIPEPEPIHN